LWDVLRLTAGLLGAGLVFASCDCVGCDILLCVGRRGSLVFLPMTFESPLSDFGTNVPEVTVELTLQSVAWVMSLARDAGCEAGGASGRGILFGPVGAAVAFKRWSPTRPCALTSIGRIGCVKDETFWPVGVRSAAKRGTRLASCRC